MQRRFVPRLPALYWLPACVAVLLFLPSAGSGSPAVSDSARRWLLLNEEQWRREDAAVTAKVAAEREVGEPRTVRMIYFLPNDRPYRQAVVDTMKARMVRLQAFFGQQMEAHGYGYMTFRYETDADGEPVVHRLDGAHADRYYHQDTSEWVTKEVWQAFDPSDVVFFIVIDNRAGDTIRDGRSAGIASGGKDGGRLIVPGGFTFKTAAHELAHAFGMLWHDYRDGAHVLSLGTGRDRLSACSAAHLSVSPFFNASVPLVTHSDLGPTVALLSPLWYDAGSESITVRVKVADPDGLHHLSMFVTDPTGHYLTPLIHGCLVLSGETEAVIEYAYDGVMLPWFTSLSDNPSHYIGFLAVDRQGDEGYEGWTFAQRSPYHLTTLEGHRWVTRLALSPDGSTLASGSADSLITLWDTKTYEKMATLRVEGRVEAVAFSPDGATLAAAVERGWIGLWDVASLERTHTLEGHTWLTYTLAFSPDGTALVSGSYFDEDRIKVWDVATGELTGILKGHVGPILQVAFSPDGSVLASASFDYSVRIWDVAARKVRYVLVRPGGRGIGTIAFSPDGRVLAADASAERLIALWDVSTGRNIADLVMAHRPQVNVLTFSPDGEILASGGPEGTVIIRDVTTGKIYARLPHTGSISSLAYWHDGSVLAAGTWRGKVELWDTSEWVRRRPERLTVVSGDGQPGAAGAALSAPLVVSVGDGDGVPFPGMPVVFAVTEGDGALWPAVARTDTSGNAATTLTLGASPGMNTVAARAAGLAPAVFTAHAHGHPDVNADGIVDFADFVLFAQAFGLNRDDEGYDVRYDLDRDGEVGFSDFLLFTKAFGQSV